MSLKDRLFSKRNIYSAIYCLESYVFEKGLLDTRETVVNEDGRIIANNDLELFYALGDKYNHKLIDIVINLCINRLDNLFSSNDNLFEISVYFKLKSYDSEGGLKLRPLHTARLIDMICMVSILMCLMYDDKDRRNLSDLSKLIPHNFYGNLPSADVQYLFKRWQIQYKQYTQSVIDHCRVYQKNRRFLAEVSLDIQNFFPSVSPQFLYRYIVDNLISAFSDDDVSFLKMAITKLLYFKINQANVEPWLEEYYNRGDIKLVEDGKYMNCGIPQGLPQSYFFGNLCMIEVRKILMKDDLFKGDAYFYVDDSVIYIHSALTEELFADRISALNSQMKELYANSRNPLLDLHDFIPERYLDFHKQLKYEIQFHEKGKSSFCHIDEADNHLGGFENLARETSMSSSLYWNMEEIDDTVSTKKLKAICAVVDKEIKRLKAKEAEDKDKELTEKDASRLKMLKRFKKFYLYRIRMLKMKTEEASVDDIFNDFSNRFFTERLTIEGLVPWFEENEEEIFQSEYRLLVQNFPRGKAEVLSNAVIALEKNIITLCQGDRAQKQLTYLYYQKDVTNSIIMKSCSVDPYGSLKQWMKENYRGIKGQTQNKQFEAFSHFLESEFSGMQENGLWGEKYMSFVARNSSEYQRRILNAYYSESIGVQCSDAYSFVKANSKKLHYTELRILVRLRNYQFDLVDFKAFVRSLNNKDVSNQMGIDLALLSVIGTFVKTVRNPDWIDGLIQTHRITKGLWYNGSKFLNSYTLHNEEHAVTLINQTVHIVKTIDYFVLKSIDYYILFLSCYLHDISMVIHPDMYIVSPSNTEIMALVSNLILKMKETVRNLQSINTDDNRNARLKESWKFFVDVFDAVYNFFENKIRSKHPSDSGDFILSKSNTLLRYLEPTLLSFVAKVSASHGWDTIDVYGLKSRAKNDTVSLKYLMILIRLADLFDVANDRVNYHLLRQNLCFLPLVSQFHWISHLVTDKLEFDADYVPFNDDNVSLYNNYITETLIVRFYLNVKYLTSKKTEKPCEDCSCKLNGDCIDINIIKGSDVFLCEANHCTLLCRWMMRKHDWLVRELIALNEYLLSVNNSLIRTNIKIQFQFSNDMDLDADLFDSIVEYLQE